MKPKEWYEMVRPFATKRSWMRYSENEKVEESPLVPDEIIKQCKSGLLAAAHEKQANLSYGKVLVGEGLDLLVADKASDWNMTKDEETHYKETMRRRFRNMMRAVDNNVKKNLKKKVWPD